MTLDTTTTINESVNPDTLNDDDDAQEQVTDEETLLLQVYDNSPFAVQQALFNNSAKLKRAVEKRIRLQQEEAEAKLPLHERLAASWEALQGRMNLLIETSCLIAEINTTIDKINTDMGKMDSEEQREQARNTLSMLYESVGTHDSQYAIARDAAHKSLLRLEKLTRKPKTDTTSTTKPDAENPQSEAYDVRGRMAAMYKVAFERGSDRKRKIATNLLALAVYAYRTQDSELAEKVRAMRHTFGSTNDNDERNSVVVKAATLVNAAKLDAAALAASYIAEYDPSVTPTH